MTIESGRKEESLTNKITPHKILAGAVAYHYIKGLQEIEENHLNIKADNRIFRGAMMFLKEYQEMMGVIPNMDTLRQYKDATMHLADIQEEAFYYGLSKKDFFKIYGEEFDTSFLSLGGYALLVKTYKESLFENFVDLCAGNLEYGFGKDTYRSSLLNHFASEVLMDPASNSIINDLSKKFPKFDVSIELGAGSGSFSKKFLMMFPFSFTEITDLNNAVYESATKNFEGAKAGDIEILEGTHFNITAMDMRDKLKLEELRKKWEGKKIFIHIGYILHESKTLADETLDVLSEVFSGSDVTFGFSEHYLQTGITDNTALVFLGLHYTTQDLMTQSELVELVTGKGFKMITEVVDGEERQLQTIHNSRIKSNGEKVIINSTTYWYLPKK